MVNKGADWSRWSDDYLTKPCEIDELVAKIEKAWEKKDDEFKKDMQEKIQKVVESPSSVFDMFPRKKWNSPPRDIKHHWGARQRPRMVNRHSSPFIPL